MKIKLSYLFILLCILTSCQKQSIINDLKFSNYSGHPKKVTEIITFSPQDKNKSISYFDNEGFLIKVEYYNTIISESPNERLIDRIITYNSKDKAKRSFEAANPENKEVESNGYFEKKSDSVYQRVTNSMDHKMSLNKLFYFDKNNRLIKQKKQELFMEPPLITPFFSLITIP